MQNENSNNFYKLVSNKPLSELEIDSVKFEVEERLDKKVLLEVSTALKK